LQERQPPQLGKEMEKEEVVEKGEVDIKEWTSRKKVT
jgi:hypothetical protein